MTLQECYARLGGDYESVVRRLMNDRIVQKFLLKFLDDTSYDTLIQAMEDGNWEEAFRAAHTIKGVSRNLGLDALGDSSSRLTESLRGGDGQESGPLLEQVKKDYEQTVSVIKAFRAEM